MVKDPLATWLMDTHKASLAYRGDEDDIFVVSYPKSGTTWVQMILYQLTTDGRMDFRHIDDVSPHFEESLVPFGKKIDDVKRPRTIKTHLSQRLVPKGPGRYIYVLRDGRDVAVSYYYQLRHAGFDIFWPEFLAGNVPYGSWFRHVSEWMENKNHLNVCFLKYEDLSSDMADTVRKLASFLSIAISESGLQRVLYNCSFEAMREHEAKFSLDKRYPSSRTKPDSASPAMLRSGRSGAWRAYFSEVMLAEYYAAFDRTLGVQPLASYRS